MRDLSYKLIIVSHKEPQPNKHYFCQCAYDAAKIEFANDAIFIPKRDVVLFKQFPVVEINVDTWIHFYYGR